MNATVEMNVTPVKSPHVPAAFINAIAEEGTKAEAVQFLQETWNDYRAADAAARRWYAAAAPYATPEALKAALANKMLCPFCNPTLNANAHAAEPMVPNGEYREIQLGGSPKPQSGRP